MGARLHSQLPGPSGVEPGSYETQGQNPGAEGHMLTRRDNLPNTRPTTAPVAPDHKCKPLSAQRASGTLSPNRNGSAVPLLANARR